MRAQFPPQIAKTAAITRDVSNIERPRGALPAEVRRSRREQSDNQKKNSTATGRRSIGC
jgi:hypothetical protein